MKKRSLQAREWLRKIAFRSKSGAEYYEDERKMKRRYSAKGAKVSNAEPNTMKMNEKTMLRKRGKTVKCGADLMKKRRLQVCVWLERVKSFL